MTMRTPSVLLLIMLFSLSGRAVTKVGRTCGPTLLLVHVCMLSNKICLNQIKSAMIEHKNDIRNGFYFSRLCFKASFARDKHFSNIRTS